MKRTILVVEDSDYLQKALKIGLKDSGFKVISAPDGREGLETAFKKHPDLILLDLKMPVMDGISTLKELRKDDWGKHVPIIILTSLQDRGKLIEAAHEGVTDFYIKSDWEIDEIVDKIRAKLL